MRFNINNSVRVKLTDTGRHHNRQEHPRSAPFLKEDADGWSRWQLWDLMHTFGSLLSLGAGRLPFETEIEIPETANSQASLDGCADHNRMLTQLYEALAPFAGEFLPTNSKASIKISEDRHGERVAMTDLDRARDKARAAIEAVKAASVTKCAVTVSTEVGAAAAWQSITSALLSKIDAYCERNGITTSTFGKYAINDGKFVKRLQDGKGITLRALGLVDDFLKRDKARAAVEDFKAGPAEPTMSVEQILEHVKHYDVGEGDPRRRFTVCQIELAIRSARRGAPVVVPDWVDDFLNRRCKVEAALRAGKPLSADEMKRLAVLLSVPSEYQRDADVSKEPTHG